MRSQRTTSESSHGDRPIGWFLLLQEDGDRLWGLVRMLRYAKSCCCRTAGFLAGFKHPQPWGEETTMESCPAEK